MRNAGSGNLIQNGERYIMGIELVIPAEDRDVMRVIEVLLPLAKQLGKDPLALAESLAWTRGLLLLLKIVGIQSPVEAGSQDIQQLADKGSEYIQACLTIRGRLRPQLLELEMQLQTLGSVLARGAADAEWKASQEK